MLNWRIALAQLLLQARLVRLAIPHLDEILVDIEGFRLERWDPAFAVTALQVVWTGYSQHKATRDSGDSVLARIAKLDPVTALHLVKK